MNRVMTLVGVLVGLIYLSLFMLCILHFHSFNPLELYYSALAKTMQSLGFAFVPHWGQTPLINLAPLWTWIAQLNMTWVHTLLWPLRLWSTLMLLVSVFLTLRLTYAITPIEISGEHPRLLSFSVITLFVLTPATAWFTLMATPWPSITAATIAAIYAGFRYTQNKKTRFYLLFWLSILALLFLQGPLWIIPLLIIPALWPQQYPLTPLLGSIRAWIVCVLLYGWYVYAAYATVGTSLFTVHNSLWFLLPTLGAYGLLNPFLPAQLMAIHAAPIWLSVLALLPLLVLLPHSCRKWMLTHTPYTVWLGLAVLALVYALMICISSDILTAVMAMQVLTPLLVVVTAPLLCQFLQDKDKYVSSLTHFSALIFGLVLLILLLLPEYHHYSLAINPVLRQALFVLLVVVYVPVIIARWVSIRVATIMAMLLLAAGSLSFAWVHTRYHSANNIHPLIMQVAQTYQSQDVVASVGILRPQVFLAAPGPVVQVSPLAAQISVPSTPLLVDPQQFVLHMKTNDRTAWVFIDAMDLKNNTQVWQSFQPVNQVGSTVLLKSQ